MRIIFENKDNTNLVLSENFFCYLNLMFFMFFMFSKPLKKGKKKKKETKYVLYSQQTCLNNLKFYKSLYNFLLNFFIRNPNTRKSFFFTFFP